MGRIIVNPNREIHLYSDQHLTLSDIFLVSLFIRAAGQGMSDGLALNGIVGVRVTGLGVSCPLRDQPRVPSMTCAAGVQDVEFSSSDEDYVSRT